MPYYAVIFTSRRTLADPAGYAAASQRMLELARQQPGFLGVDSARSDDGLGITVSYWESEQAIRQWQAHAEHLLAQARGKSAWYGEYQLRVCRVEREYAFAKEEPPT